MCVCGDSRPGQLSWLEGIEIPLVPAALSASVELGALGEKSLPPHKEVATTVVLHSFPRNSPMESASNTKCVCVGVVVVKLALVEIC